MPSCDVMRTIFGFGFVFHRARLFYFVGEPKTNLGSWVELVLGSYRRAGQP